MILTSQILELNQAELEQAVETELSENPALERIDEGEAGPSSEEILRAVAPRELQPNGECHELWRSLPRDGAEVDWTELAPSADTLWDHLRAQMVQRLPDIPHKLVEYIVGSVNERGYLCCTPEEAALDCHCSLEEAEQTIEQLRLCDPAGVGASDLRECLLLQLRDASTDEERMARAILKNDWECLVQRDVKSIRRRYRVPFEFVEEAFEVIVALNPFPGEGFGVSTRHTAEKSAPATPDLVLERHEQGWIIEVGGPSPLSFRIEKEYERRYKDCKKSNKDERRHVTEFVDRAKTFLDAVSQRRRLMLEIGRYLIEHQSGFVTTGEYRFLKALTRSQVAQDLGAHESTVSRATNGKFVQIATGEVVPFDVFFKPALRVQKLIEEILASENPNSPLSDESISRILQDHGIKVARRTVNKYRDRTRLLSSRRRKSA